MSAWKVAGERLTELGSALKEHYEERRAEVPGSEPSPKDAASAKQKLTGAVQEAFEAMGAAAKDPTVKDDVRRVGRSLAGALGATFAQVGDDLRRVAAKAPEAQAPTHAVSPSEPGSSSDDPAVPPDGGDPFGHRPPAEPGA